MMTQQEVFTRVKEHLLAQGCKSLDPIYDDVCLYRGNGKTKCAIGCLIPDDKYSPRMEGKRLGTILYIFPDALPEVGEESYGLLRHLQQVHDCSSVDEWSINLQRIAQEFGLTY